MEAWERLQHSECWPWVWDNKGNELQSRTVLKCQRCSPSFSTHICECPDVGRKGEESISVHLSVAFLRAKGTNAGSKATIAVTQKWKMLNFTTCFSVFTIHSNGWDRDLHCSGSNHPYNSPPSFARMRIEPVRRITIWNVMYNFGQWPWLFRLATHRRQHWCCFYIVVCCS